MQQALNVIYFPKTDFHKARFEIFRGQDHSFAYKYEYNPEIPFLESLNNAVTQALGNSAQFIISSTGENCYIAVEVLPEEDTELVKCHFVREYEAVDGERFDTKEEAEQHSKVHLLYTEIVEQVNPDFRDFDLREVLEYLFKNRIITKL